MTELPRRCPDDHVVADFLAGALPPERARALEDHVDRCAACAALMIELARTEVAEADESLGAGGEDDVGPPPGALAGADPGSLAGRYRLQGELGQGAMGVVYRAWDRVLEREVAVKLLRPDLPPGEAEALGERMAREARLLARVTHPNVVRVYDAGLADGAIYLAMEHVEGATLSGWLAAAPRPGWEILQRFVQAGRGLAAAHEAGLVHRDVKPDNLLVGVDGQARISDFGLALPVVPGPGQGEPSRLTREATLVGTPAYMPPEQLAGGAVDARSDQYALCASLLEALVGRGATQRERWIKEALKGEDRDRVRLDALPAPVRAALDRGLSPVPEERFPTVSALVDALTPACDPRAWRPPRRRAILALVALTVVGLAAVLTLLLWLGGATETVRGALERAATGRVPAEVAPPGPEAPTRARPAPADRRRGGAPSRDAFERLVLGIAGCGFDSIGIDSRCPAWRALQRVERRLPLETRFRLKRELAPLHFAHPSASVRYYLADEVLDVYRHRPEVRRKVHDLARRETEVRVLRRLLGVMIVSAREHPEVIDVIVRRSRDPDPQIRAWSAFFLGFPGAAGHPKAAARVVEILDEGTELATIDLVCPLAYRQGQPTLLARFRRLTADPGARPFTPCMVGLVRSWSAEDAPLPNKEAYALSMARLRSQPRTGGNPGWEVVKALGRAPVIAQPDGTFGAPPWYRRDEVLRLLAELAAEPKLYATTRRIAVEGTAALGGRRALEALRSRISDAATRTVVDERLRRLGEGNGRPPR